MQLEQRPLGDYIVKELTLGQLLDIREQYPQGGSAMTAALIACAVHTSGGQPIGLDGARNLPARFALRLSTVVNQLTAVDEDEQKNE